VPLSRRGHGSACRDAQSRSGGRDLLATGCDGSGREVIRPGRRIFHRTSRVSFPCCQIREGSARAHRVPSALIAPSRLFPSGVRRESSLAFLCRPLSVACWLPDLPRTGRASWLSRSSARSNAGYRPWVWQSFKNLTPLIGAFSWLI